MRNINIKRLKALEARFNNVEIYIMADDGEYETYGLKFKKWEI